MTIKKIWHNYLKWEDYQNGMYATISGDDRKEMLKKAIEFTGDHEFYGLYMLDVIEKWSIACEQNLTDIRINRLAWLGHAACCLAFGCPEDITREAWGYLTEEQQVKADAEASKVILIWESRHEKQNLELREEMGRSRVS